MSEEIWLIRGNTPVHWTMPFAVSWDIGARVASMHVAINVNLAQLVGIKAFLRGRAHAYSGERFWRVKRHVLEEIGKHIEEPGPLEYYMSWSRPIIDNKTTQAEILEQMDRKDFVYGLYQKGVGKSVEEVEWWWLQFCQHIGDTLINHQKPIDLYWFKLHFSPYRQNWKEYVLHRIPRLGMLVCAANELKKEAYLHNEGAYDLFLNPDMLAMSTRTGTVFHHVEVEHRLPWWRETQRAERARMRKQGDRNYARHVLDSIKRRLKATVRIYIEYLNHIARPSAADVHCGDDGSFRLAPNAAWRKRIPARETTYFVPVVVPNKHKGFTPASTPERLLGKDGSVPALSVVRSKKKNVRNRKRDDQGSGDGEK